MYDFEKSVFIIPVRETANGCVRMKRYGLLFSPDRKYALPDTCLAFKSNPALPDRYVSP